MIFWNPEHSEGNPIGFKFLEVHYAGASGSIGSQV
jgi:hypothetical protein